jgi:hypothetical protein
VLNTFTIITTDPNALVRPVHNRMPVIYDKEMGKQWLEHSFGDRARTLAAVHPGYDLYEPKSAACQLNISVSFLKDSVKNDPSAPVIMGWGIDSPQRSGITGVVGWKAASRNREELKPKLFFLPLLSGEFERPPHTFRYGFSR